MKQRVVAGDGERVEAGARRQAELGRAFSSLMISAADAPSVSGEELPGVMSHVDLGEALPRARRCRTTACSPASPSAVVDARTVSSTRVHDRLAVCVGDRDRDDLVVEVPAAVAAAARWCERAENASRRLAVELPLARR